MQDGCSGAVLPTAASATTTCDSSSSASMPCLASASPATSSASSTSPSPSPASRPRVTFTGVASTVDVAARLPTVRGSANVRRTPPRPNLAPRVNGCVRYGSSRTTRALPTPSAAAALASTAAAATTGIPVDGTHLFPGIPDQREHPPALRMRQELPAEVSNLCPPQPQPAPLSARPPAPQPDPSATSGMDVDTVAQATESSGAAGPSSSDAAADTSSDTAGPSAAATSSGADTDTSSRATALLDSLQQAIHLSTSSANLAPSSVPSPLLR